MLPTKYKDILNLVLVNCLMLEIKSFPCNNFYKTLLYIISILFG